MQHMDGRAELFDQRDGVRQGHFRLVTEVGFAAAECASPQPVWFQVLAISNAKCLNLTASAISASPHRTE
jgi:hypothetical protein